MNYKIDGDTIVKTERGVELPDIHPTLEKAKAELLGRYLRATAAVRDKAKAVRGLRDGKLGVEVA